MSKSRRKSNDEIENRLEALEQPELIRVIRGRTSASDPLALPAGFVTTPVSYPDLDVGFAGSERAFDNSNGAYNTTTGILTSPRDAFYIIVASANFDPGSLTDNQGFALETIITNPAGGTTFGPNLVSNFSADEAGNPNGRPVGGSALPFLKAGDTLQITARGNIAANLVGDARTNYLHIVELPSSLGV